MSEGDNLDAISKKLDALFQQMETGRVKLHEKIDHLSGTV